jgi:rhamnogalacturonan endolyase
MRFFLPIFILSMAAVSLDAADVTVRQDRRAFEISNGSLTAIIEKSSGRILSAVLDGRELLGKGTGYWSMSASSGRSPVGGFGVAIDHGVTIDPATDGGERAEVVCRFKGTGADGSYPGESELRYAMDRHSTTLYATAVMRHGPGDAPFRVGEARFVVKVDPEIFDHMTIDRKRNRLMPTGRDWELATPLNMKEVRRLTTGVHAGWAEHKYGYSAILGQLPAYGWLGTKRRFGVWIINPSVEYIAGGPTKMELTGHLDVGGEALPTLLNMWHGSHYGGSVLSLDADEKWSKVIGPFALHFNKDGSPDELEKMARQQAMKERAAWPYDWVRQEDYPQPQARGGMAGKIGLYADTGDVPTSGRMWVGLTAKDYEAHLYRQKRLVGWQRDGKNYQYWGTARPDGSFQLGGVRPGTYVLRAFADGVPGEYLGPEIQIREGMTLPVKTYSWKVDRCGPTLWEIGIPDRSAAEFKNGDRYWHWGNYLKYQKDFPNGVDYVVGKSDWKKDWHLCQPLVLSPEGRVLGNSAWNVRFPLKTVPPGGVRLRVSFCGSRDGAELELQMNGVRLDQFMLPENGAMHRDSHRGFWFERMFEIPAGGLRTGENLLEFKLSGRYWHQGVLYDYIQLEEVIQPPLTSDNR